MGKLDTLKEKLKERIDHFNNESQKHKQTYRCMRYSVFILTACSTALASLAVALPSQPNHPDYPKIFSLFIILFTAVAGVITSIEGLRKPGELWIHERTTYYALRDLQDTIDYRCAEGEVSDVADEVFARMQAILGASNDKWNRQFQNRDAKDPALLTDTSVDKEGRISLVVKAGGNPNDQ